MKLSIFNLLVFVFCFNCSKKCEDVYYLKSQIKKVPTKLLRFATEDEFKNSKYKIDYSEKGYIKISYNNKNKIKLLQIGNKFYNYYDLNRKDSLNSNSYLYLSLNPKDSYQRFYEIDKSNDVPPPPYQFSIYNDSIIFKNEGNLTKVYLKDNNENRIKSWVIYYDSNFKIMKIEEKLFDIIINYE